MTIGYFDCFAGASGDMILGSLIDVGLDPEYLRSELAKLNLSGYKLNIKKDTKNGISGTKVDVIIEDKHHHRGLGDITKIIDQSNLDSYVKITSKKIFTKLARVEADIHNKSVEEIHFHEVGAVDAIIDITGAVIGFNYLNIDEIHISKIHIGTGTLECAHGTLPVPAPATLKLLKNFTVYSTGIEKELVTPTGAAILSTMAVRCGCMPEILIKETGFGLGTRDLTIPNILRFTIGTKTEFSEPDSVQMIETNIDDMNPQFYEHIMEILFNKGAKDVFLTPVIMKKNRPGVVLNVLSAPEKIDELTKIIFDETTTLGVRLSEVKKRKILHREILNVTTPWGKARVKIRTLDNNIKTVAPEYDDCKKLAKENKIPITRVFDTIREIALKKI